jgi:hypothetical protein
MTVWKGPTFFAQRKNFFVQLIFPPKIFSGILEKGNLSEQKILAGKNSLNKKGFPVWKRKILTVSCQP